MTKLVAHIAITKLKGGNQCTLKFQFHHENMKPRQCFNTSPFISQNMKHVGRSINTLKPMVTTHTTKFNTKNESVFCTAAPTVYLIVKLTMQTSREVVTALRTKDGPLKMVKQL